MSSDIAECPLRGKSPSAENNYPKKMAISLGFVQWNTFAYFLPVEG